MIETIEATRREVVVEVGRERAFELFTADMTSWWPPGAWMATLVAYAARAGAAA